MDMMCAQRLPKDCSGKAAHFKVLAEGKHWPEDYIKTAFSLIKQSPIGQQPWYSDEFIKADVQTFINEFAPLSHKSSNLGFFMAIIRWFIEYAGTSKEKYQEFIERKLDGIIGTLQTVLNDPSYDKIKNEIKTKWTLQKFEELQQKISDEAKASSDKKLKSIVKRNDYDMIPIYGYEELHEKFGGSWTGYNGESEWCHTNGKSTYESWTKNGTQMFFVLAKKDWKSIKVPTQKPNKEDNAYDEYGLSLIAILVDVATGNLLNETLRWNHIIEPSYTNPGASVDKAFKNNWGELSQAVGMDVKAACEKECKDLKQMLQKEADAANKQVAEILRGKTEIDDDTIPKALKSKLTKVVILNSVMSIGNFAFYGCRSLTSVTIPNSVTSIGYSAFRDCHGLTSVSIGNRVTSIWSMAFCNCPGLMSVTIPDSVTSIGGGAFDGCTRLMAVTIGNGVTNIGDAAFRDCYGLTSVAIPNGVTRIESFTFQHCAGLTNLTIPDRVTSIGNFAFSSCSSLTSITIPSSVTSIGYMAFYKCTNLKKLIFKEKSIDEVMAMKYYPWGIEDESIISCEDDLNESKKVKLKMKKDKKVDEASFKSFNDIDLSKIPGSVAEILTTNFERFNSCKTYEDVVALCHQLFDDAKLNTEWTRKFFYSLEKIREYAPTPRAAYEQAMLFMNNARMRGMGLGMDRGTGRYRFYEGDELNESMDSIQKEEFKKKLRDGEVKFSYKKKDGSVRDARGTMKPELMDLPEKKSQPEVDTAERKKVRKLPEDSVFYYDLDKKGFRSFKMENFVE